MPIPPSRPLAPPSSSNPRLYTDNPVAAANTLKKSQSHEGSGRTAAIDPSVVAAAANAAAAQGSGKKVKDLNEFFRMTSGDSKKVSKTTSLDGTTAVVNEIEETMDEAEDTVADEEIDQDEEEDDDEEDGAVDYTGGTLCLRYERLPPPAVFGDGNPFLMFMCLACLLQHRDYIMEQQLDYQEIAMHFDRMVRRHNVSKTLRLARRMFAEYLNDDWRREGQTHSRRQNAKAC